LAGENSPATARSCNSHDNAIGEWMAGLVGSAARYQIPMALWACLAGVLQCKTSGDMSLVNNEDDKNLSRTTKACASDLQAPLRVSFLDHLFT
jgi:hypothetical protein